MIERIGNIWDYYPSNIIAVTTNGILNSRSELVMGKGIALEAKYRNPNLPKTLGGMVKQFGNIPFLVDRIISFPTKHHWKDKSDIELIKQSARILVELAKGRAVYLTRPGCGCGGLKWENVKPVIAEILTDNFTILTQN